MSFSTVFPAPGTLIDSAGQANANGLPAPGFSGLNVKANQSVQVYRARSNRGLPISSGTHFWSFQISYHEMTIEQYEAIEMFLLGHNAKLNPFYITLPNYSEPRPSTYESFVNGADLTVDSGSYAGDRTITIDSSNTTLIPGCYINLIDDADALHKSTYKVARVETPTTYTGDAPAGNKLRLTLFPPLQRDFVGNVTARFSSPQFRVIQTSDLDVEYTGDNTVNFSFACAEILP